MSVESDRQNQCISPTLISQEAKKRVSTGTEATNIMHVGRNLPWQIFDTGRILRLNFKYKTVNTILD